MTLSSVRHVLIGSIAMIGGSAQAAFAGSPAIGVVTASGHFTLDHSEIWSNATLFEGSRVETLGASSEASLRNGVRLQLGAKSVASIQKVRTDLIQGTLQLSGPETYEVSARGVAIQPILPSMDSAPKLRVSMTNASHLEVFALAGAARVISISSGAVLASIPAGRKMDFALQAAAAGAVTRTGCLVSKDGRFLLQDQNTQEVIEVNGANLGPNTGNRVTVSGNASTARPTISAAMSVLNATSIATQAQGGCLSVAVALDARTEPTVAGSAPVTRPASPIAAAPAKTAPPAKSGGMSTGAKVGIIAAIGGGGAGAAIALAGGKKSTSP